MVEDVQPSNRQRIFMWLYYLVPGLAFLAVSFVKNVPVLVIVIVGAGMFIGMFVFGEFSGTLTRGSRHFRLAMTAVLVALWVAVALAFLR